MAVGGKKRCTIISNLLNNAIEACEKYKRTKE
ncbi:MAG: GHKL domain-containing protein [[Eubacterium] rectale]|nr:GHKL domain-containing protein [Agathobacter rectalis]